jgi:hypothetical protein
MAEANNRVEQSLYQRAVGHSFNSEKVFCNNDSEVTHAPIVEQAPSDVTAQIFWLRNAIHLTGVTLSSFSTADWKNAVALDTSPRSRTAPARC